MSDPILLALSGSLRAEATNRKLMREAARLFEPGTYIEADLNLPLYDGDVETGQGIPDKVQLLADQIAQADAVIISTPEYNKGPSGVLKNALDWVSRTKGHPWMDKPVAVMSAAAGRAGGERAQMVLRTFLVPFQPRVLSGPEIHLADSSNEFDEQGRLSSDRYEKSLHTLMQKLRAELGR
ncbi:NAD(P)H-dependent oxidoreductase [Ruegeria sp.]|uniref:NADPH-dependent FMN reductase n=1 Tax=Ruegeria sp. TaxID=1879320 RepID=UPI002309EC1D|nr:NAD(P)H-dependent oxidoreductase [Ruegeria sp.]MDA7966357.1 NAD(P)H-dependent oxidoreductase [Ruegeria sp.]